MDGNRLAREFGRSLAAGTVAHTLTLEAGVTQSPIFPHPVPLEPFFRPFDPLQTFERPRHPIISLASAPVDWAVRRLLLPATTSVDWARAEAFVASLAGCPGPLSFSIFADHANVSFLLGASGHHLGFLTGAWQAAYPAAVIVDTADPLARLQAGKLILYDLYASGGYHRALRTSQALTPWASFLQICTQLREGQAAFVDLLFTPTRQEWRKNIGALLEAERSLAHRSPTGRTITPKNLAEPIFAAAIRIGATTPSVAPGIEAFTGMFTTDGQPLRYRTINDFHRVLSPADVLEMLRRRTTHTAGQLLTSSELALFVHPPDLAACGSLRVAFVQGLPVPDRLRTAGMPLGVNDSRGVPINVVHPLHEHNKSVWMMGASRKGKSSSLVHRCRFLAQQGYGVGLIDPHRTTAFDLLGALENVAPERVVFLDFDAPLPVAYNPFVHDNPEEYGRLTTEYVNSLKHLFDASGYHRMTHILGMGLYALFVLQHNLATLPIILSRTPAGDHLRRRVIATAPNASVRRFWQEEFPLLSKDAVAPILNRLSALLLDDRTLRTFIQQENRVDITDIMDTGKVLIVAPPASIEAASIVGGLTIAQAKHAAFRRAGTPRAAQHFHLGIDEFHRFITSAKTLQSIIDEAAKGGLSVCLANQETGQIPGDLLKAMYSIPNIMVYGVNLPDAKQLSHLFHGNVSAETLAAQGTGSVYARIGQDIVNYQCPPPITGELAVAARVIAHSQEHFHTTASSTPPAPVRQPRTIDTFEEDQ